jgi:tetratricopeptide (TPR) repeat protein
MARVEGGGAASALEAIKEAIRLSPRNEQYVFNLGQISETAKKWDTARAIFERLQSSANPQIAVAARKELEQLATVQKYGISSNAPKHVAQTSPFDELEQEAQKRAQAQPEESAPDKRPTEFVKGLLLSVDCSHTPAAVLLVNNGRRSLKLRTSDYKTLLVMGEDRLSCEWRNRRVSVNYKPGGAADGDLVSVEVQ